MRLDMLEITKVQINQNLQISKSNINLKVDIIHSDPLLKQAPELDKLAKELKEIVNETRKIKSKQPYQNPAKNIHEELLPHWLSPAFSNNPSFEKYPLKDIAFEIDQGINSIYNGKMNLEIS